MPPRETIKPCHRLYIFEKKKWSFCQSGKESEEKYGAWCHLPSNEIKNDLSISYGRHSPAQFFRHECSRWTFIVECRRRIVVVAPRRSRLRASSRSDSERRSEARLSRRRQVRLR